MKKILTPFLVFLIACQLFGQRTVGLLQYTEPNLDGYVLFSPISSTNSYLINKCGESVHQWSSAYRPGQSLYFLEDGNLLRSGCAQNTVFTSGGNGGIIEKLDWNSTVLWSYQISSPTECQHHDICPLPNGNVLAISWELIPNATAIAAGRDPSKIGASLWCEKVIELQPTGTNTANIVWEWHLWDHLVQEFDNTLPNFDSVSFHPELINVNYNANNQADWIHMNAIDYNPSLDQIMLSGHNFNEIYIIDHSTTTAEAASHSGGNSGMGGDLMYRWGNPAAYNRGLPSDKKLFGQHNAQWLKGTVPDAQKIIVFNNGNGRPGGNYSSLDKIDPPKTVANLYTIGSTTPFGPATAFYSYTAPTPTDFYGANISGVDPQPDGSFVVCTGPSGIFFELNAAHNKVWEYKSPVANTGPVAQGSNPTMNVVFRCGFYAPDYAGFTGHTLTAGSEIELNPLLPSICDSLITASVNPDIYQSGDLIIYPNPSNGIVNIHSPTIINDVIVRDNLGRIVYSGNHSRIDISEFPAGIYSIQIVTDELTENKQFIKN